MKINEFAKKYGTDKRSVDYWTILGLIHPSVNEKNGYRDYGEEAEKDIKKILILKAMGWSANKCNMIYFENLPMSFIKERMKEEFQKVQEQYTATQKMLKELKGRK